MKSVGKTQINLVFLSLNRNIETTSRSYSRSEEKINFDLFYIPLA